MAPRRPYGFIVDFVHAIQYDLLVFQLFRLFQYFSFFIKDKIGNPVYYGEFRYSFSASQWQAPGGYNRDGTANWTGRAPNQVTGISLLPRQYPSNLPIPPSTGTMIPM